jgi:hypothetical protein
MMEFYLAAFEHLGGSGINLASKTNPAQEPGSQDKSHASLFIGRIDVPRNFFNSSLADRPG